MIESDCMSLPSNTITTPTSRTALCFDEGAGGNVDITNTYSGFYELESVTALYNGRNYWINKNDAGAEEYYLYYDDTWRYWVITHASTGFSTNENLWDLYCLEWREYEPWNCGTWYSKALGTTYNMQICTETPTQAPTKTPTEYPTDIGCSANYAYVTVESSDVDGLQETLTSIRTDFPVYAYEYNIIHRELVLFADGDLPTVTENNPCNSHTWTYLPAYYNGKIVMFDYDDDFVGLCTIQKWVLEMQDYANVKAVLIANNKDLTHVYSLEGDMKLDAPTIPSRMISQISGQNIKNEMNRTQENVWITIDCFDKELPTMICVLDEDIYEYQQQSGVSVNDHPVWLKEGMFNIWDDHYIWLSVNHSRSDHPWRWVIGTDYLAENTIFAQCLLPTDEYIDDPTLCGPNWYNTQGELIGNLTSNDGICDLADSYVCTSSGSGFFNYYFEGGLQVEILVSKVI